LAAVAWQYERRGEGGSDSALEPEYEAVLRALEERAGEEEEDLETLNAIADALDALKGRGREVARVREVFAGRLDYRLYELLPLPDRPRGRAALRRLGHPGARRRCA
jgi:hypothetical protein